MPKEMKHKRFQIFGCFDRAAGKQTESNQKNPFFDMLRQIREKLDTEVDFFLFEPVHSRKAYCRE